MLDEKSDDKSVILFTERMRAVFVCEISSEEMIG
jgi:hypothetical protein